MTKLKLFQFTIGDVDEPEIVMQQIVYARLRSKPEGKWALDNAASIMYTYDSNNNDWFYRVEVFADFEDPKLATEYKLRFA